jgi:hypothetical protein
MGDRLGLGPLVLATLRGVSCTLVLAGCVPPASPGRTIDHGSSLAAGRSDSGAAGIGSGASSPTDAGVDQAAQEPSSLKPCVRAELAFDERSVFGFSAKDATRFFEFGEQELSLLSGGSETSAGPAEFPPPKGGDVARVSFTASGGRVVQESVCIMAGLTVPGALSVVLPSGFSINTEALLVIDPDLEQVEVPTADASAADRDDGYTYRLIDKRFNTDTLRVRRYTGKPKLAQARSVLRDGGRPPIEAVADFGRPGSGNAFLKLNAGGSWADWGRTCAAYNAEPDLEPRFRDAVAALGRMALQCRATIDPQAAQGDAGPRAPPKQSVGIRARLTLSAFGLPRCGSLALATIALALEWPESGHRLDFAADLEHSGGGHTLAATSWKPDGLPPELARLGGCGPPEDRRWRVLLLTPEPGKHASPGIELSWDSSCGWSYVCRAGEATHRKWPSPYLPELLP